MTHNTLKAKLEKDFYAFIKTLPSRVGETPESAIWDFISRTYDEIAKAAFYAGRQSVIDEMEESKRELLEGFAYRPRQLAEHFGELEDNK